jgi:hypothetical protein
VLVRAEEKIDGTDRSQEKEEVREINAWIGIVHNS